MDKRKEDAQLAILVALLIVGVAVALVYFEILPPAALAITALYLALVAGLVLLVLWLRSRPSPETIDPLQAAQLIADLEERVDATWRNLDGAAQPAVKQAMPYQPYYRIGAIYHTRALSALQKGRGAADRWARGVIGEWPLALAPLFVPMCMELGQRALEGRQRSQAIKCLDQAGRLADDLDEVSRSIDGLGRHEKTEIQKLLRRARSLLASDKRGASPARLPNPAIAQVRAAEQTLKSLLAGPLRVDNPRKEAVVAAFQDRQKIQRVLDDADGNLARQTTPQQQGEAMLLEASKQCREVEVVLNDLDRRGGACAGLRARTQTVKQRLHEQEFRPRTRRNGNELAEMDALDKEMSQLRDQVFRLRDARRAVEEVYQKNQQHVEQELTWITAAEVKGYVLDRTRPVMGEALDWLGKLKQLLTTEDLDALIQLDAIDQEIGGRITDIRTLGATFSQHRYEYEQLRRDMKTPRVDEICQQAVSVADELDSVHEHYRQWLQPDALRRLANTVREAWSGLGPEMAQPRESRLEYLAGRLRHAKGSLDQLVKLQKEARQNLAGRHKEQTEVRSKYDELDAMLGAWRARGADQDDGMVSDFARWSAHRESLRLTLDQPATNYAETNTLAEGVVNEARARFSAYTDEHERVKADLKALEVQLKADRQALWDLNQHSLVNFEERVTQLSSRVDTWLHRYDDGMRQKRPLTAVRELLVDGQNLDGDIRGVRAEIEREDALLKASRDRADEKWQEAQLAWLEFRQNALGGREWDSERWYAGDLAQLRTSLDAAGRQLVDLVAPLKRRAPADLHGGFDQIEQALVRARDLAHRQAIKAGREIGELRAHKERLETAVGWYGRQASRQPNLMSQWTARQQDVMDALQASCRAARQAGNVSAALILALEQANDFGRRLGFTQPAL